MPSREQFAEGRGALSRTPILRSYDIRRTAFQGCRDRWPQDSCRMSDMVGYDEPAIALRPRNGRTYSRRVLGLGGAACTSLGRDS